MIQIKATKILGTACTVFSAWEPAPSIFGGHSTKMHIDGKLFGRVGTRELPREIEAIPYGSERLHACDVFRSAQYEEAYRAIVAAHPEAASGMYDMGQIEIWH